MFASHLLCLPRCERALALLDAVDDGHVAEWTLAYARLFSANQMRCDSSSTNRMRQSLPPNDLGVEVAWHTHMLHPLCYRACCNGTSAQFGTLKVAEVAFKGTEADRLSEWAGLDLVAAIRRCVHIWGLYIPPSPNAHTDVHQHRNTTDLSYAPQQATYISSAYHNCIPFPISNARQQRFMRTIVSHRAQLDTPGCVAEAAANYITFLKCAATSTEDSSPPSVGRTFDHSSLRVGARHH